MSKNSLKFPLYTLLLFFLLWNGCNRNNEHLINPLWVLETTYPISFLQDINGESIGASAINRFNIINKRELKIAREIPIVGSSISGMWLEDHRLYYGSADHFFRCYDIDQQKLIWEYPTLMPNEALPAIDDRCMYGGSRDHSIYTIDKFRGDLKWKFQTKSSVYARPVLLDSLVLVGSWDTHLYALLRETGKKVWEFTARAGIDQTPIIFERTLWLPNYDYHIYGIDLQNGQIKYNLAAENAFEFSGGHWQNMLIFSGIDRHFYFINPQTGQFFINGKSPVAVSASPLVSNNCLFTGHYDGSLYCWELPAMTNTLLHRFDDRVLSILSDGQYLWATSWDRTMVCFHIPAEGFKALPPE